MTLLGSMVVARGKVALVSACAVLACALAGCSQHARVMCEPLELAFEGEAAAAVAAIDETGLSDSNNNRFLYHAQRGHLLHLAGDYEASNRDFEAALAAAEELEPWSVTESLTDYALNEAAKAYAGEDYERAYLHYYMALNYLEMDDLQGALIECRRLDEVFRELDARYEDDGRYQDDGFIRYLSALIYQAMGKRDDARIDFEMAMRAYEGEMDLEAGVPVPPGLAASLEETEDRVGWARGPAGPTEIVVIVDSGWAPYKVEESVKVPIHRALVPEELRGRTNLAALVKIAYPEFVSPPGAGVPFRAGIADSSGAWVSERPAELVQDLDTLARSVLERRKPALVLRSTLRATAKQVALARAKHEKEEERDRDSDKRAFAEVSDERGSVWKTIFGWLFENLATQAVAETEQADTRSWVLLPAEVWMVRIPAEPGEHEVMVQALDGSAPVSLGSVRLERGEKVFRSARFFGGPHPVRCDD